MMRCWLTVCLWLASSTSLTTTKFAEASSPLPQAGSRTVPAAPSSFSSCRNQPEAQDDCHSEPLPPTTATTTTTGIFGVIQRLPSVVSMRGGAVLEPESHDDVKALIVKAGSEQKLVVIDFTATWCGPCKMMAPVFQELSETYGDNVVFLKVDVDENPETAAQYNVSAMPTFVFIKGGQVVERLMGANPSRLQELLQEYQ